MTGANRVPKGNSQIMLDYSGARLRAWCRAHGFTLVELMIVIVIAAVLLMLAVPSFQRLILSNKLTTTATAMADTLNLARLDAIKLNANTQFCGSTGNGGDALGGACTPARAVFTMPQGATTAGQARAAPVLAESIEVSGDVAAVRFSGQGFGFAPTAPGVPFSANVATICTSRLATDNQRIVRLTTGSIPAVATSTGACP